MELGAGARDADFLQLADAELRGVLPWLAMLVGLASGLAVFAHGFFDTGHFHPWVLAGHVGLTGLGVWWWRRPPWRIRLAALGVAFFLATRIGLYTLESGDPGTLLHLAILSVGCFYFLMDLRILAVAQTYLAAWFCVTLWQLSSTPALAQHTIVAVVAWCAGLALYVGRRRVLVQLAETRHALEQESEERRLAQAQALAAQKAESLGVMAGGVAHDFNNLLVGILGGADLARDAGDDRAARDAALDIVHEAAVSARDLTREMLDYAGGRAVPLEALDLNDVVREAIREAGARMPEGLALRSDLALGLPPVRGEHAQLQQAVLHLLTNAAEAQTGGGAIRIRTRVAADGRIRLRVEDDGPGVPEAIHDRIFDPFFTTKFAGRGLGLANVMATARSHGGSIEVETNEKGSAFELRLPQAAAAEAAATSSPASDDGWRGNGCVLLIDDDAVVRDAAAPLLERLGFAVHPVASGHEAVQELRRRPDRFRLALVDATMPELDGPATIQALREIRPGLPVLLSSGFASGPAREERGLPADVPFLPKPYDRRALAGAVRRALHEVG